MISRLTCALGAIGLVVATHADAQDRSYVTDIAPIAALVKAIDPDSDITVLTLGADPHAIALRPSHVRAIVNADAVFWAGPDFSPWLDGALANRDVPAVALTAAEGHGWLDPSIASDWLSQIEGAIADFAPAHAAMAQENGEIARARLADLATEITERLASARDVPVLVSHDAYSAFAARFGVNIVAHITDGHDHAPGTSHLSELQEMIASDDIACVFEEAGEHNEHAHLLTEGTDIFTATLDPLGQTPDAPDAYLTLIENVAATFNACALAQAKG